jgi:hypothetical protein
MRTNKAWRKYTGGSMSSETANLSNMQTIKNVSSPLSFADHGTNPGFKKSQLMVPKL